MVNTRLLKLISLLLLVLFILLGMKLASRKPLWNDEIFTQVHAIEKLSMVEILLGKVPEGNNSPLFYIIQKTICSVLAYHFPVDWDKEWNIAEPWGQIILRLAPNFFISASLAILFFFFVKNYSWRAGIYAVSVSLSSLLVWVYWAEARPYALWLMLTTIQCLLFHQALQLSDERNFFSRLFSIHVLLSLTASISIVQNFLVAIILWSAKKDTKQFLFLGVIPAAVSLFYYFLSPRFAFGLPAQPFLLILQAAAPEYLFIIALFAAVLFRQKKVDEKETMFIWLLALSLVSAAALILLMMIKNSQGGFYLNARYFIYLTPMTTVLTVCAAEKIIFFSRRSGWLLLNAVMIIDGLLILRALKTFLDVYNMNLY